MQKQPKATAPAAPAALEQILSGYDSLQAVVSELRNYPEFAEVSVSTLFRWRSAEAAGEGLPPRARRAVQLLAPVERVEVSIPYHDAPLFLPLLVMEDELNMRVGEALTKKYGFKLKRLAAKSGVDALTQLKNNKADIAFCFRHFKAAAGFDNCVRLCTYCEYDLDGVLMGVEADNLSRVHLREIKFGFPAASAVGEFLESEVAFKALRGLKPVPIASVDEAVSFLKGEDSACYAGWNPLVREATARLEKEKVKPLQLPRGLLSPIAIDLFVNRTTGNAGGLLKFLRALAEVTSRLEAHVADLNATEVETLKSRLKLDKNELKDVAKNYDFALNNVSLGILFAMWNVTENTKPAHQ
jgi:hypothetical protein